eukprot:1159779-Alexandrium_andersonii.AAC.1
MARGLRTPSASEPSARAPCPCAQAAPQAACSSLALAPSRVSAHCSGRGSPWAITAFSPPPRSRAPALAKRS